MLPFSFWQSERDFLLGILLPKLQAMALAGATAGSDKLTRSGIAFDNELANEAAARWARGRANQLVDLVTSTSERTAGEILANWIETPGSTIEDLMEQLPPVLGNNEARAEAIAITEVTTAYAEGEAIVYRNAGIPPVVFKPPGHVRCRCWTAVRYRGKVPVVVWLTNRDEIVCKRPIETPWGMVRGCWELDGTIISEGEWLGQKLRR